MNPPPFSRCVFLSAFLPLLSAAATKNRSFQQHDIVTEKELLVTALDVVSAPEASYPGVWSFGHLMDQAFGADKSRQAVASWLDTWSKGIKTAADGVIAVPGREELESRLIAPWKERDAYRPGSGEPWLPDFSHAPFRLLAIVNRLDLGKPADFFSLPPGTNGPTAPDSYYSGIPGINSDAGEARLVFALVGPDGTSPEGGMTIIFEYGLDATKQERTYDWAMAWHRLGSHAAFDADYRSDLVQLTRLFTDRRPKAGPTTTPPAERKTGVMERLAAEAAGDTFQLLRVRINDGACGKLREFREFTLSKEALVPAPLAGSPDEPFFTKGSPQNRWLSRWIADQVTAAPSTGRERTPPKEIIPASFTLPVSFSDRGKQVPVTAHVATVPGNDPAFHWDGWGMRDSALRRAFSMQTCCGCHCGDTSTRFFHIEPRPENAEAGLSKFLRTDGSRWRPKDPADRGSFLSSEMEDRKQLFHTLLNPDLSHREIQRIRGSRQGRVH